MNLSNHYEFTNSLSAINLMDELINYLAEGRLACIIWKQYMFMIRQSLRFISHCLLLQEHKPSANE